MPQKGVSLERRHYDEMRAADGEVRAHFRALADWLAETPAERVAEKRLDASQIRAAQSESDTSTIGPEERALRTGCSACSRKFEC